MRGARGSCLPRRSEPEAIRFRLRRRARDAPDLDEAQLRADLRLEKHLEFEDTQTWARTRQSWAALYPDDPPDYARLPDVALDSPKLSADLTTRWFAEKVEARHRNCMKRAPEGG